MIKAEMPFHEASSLTGDVMRRRVNWPRSLKPLAGFVQLHSIAIFLSRFYVFLKLSPPLHMIAKHETHPSI